MLWESASMHVCAGLLKTLYIPRIFLKDRLEHKLALFLRTYSVLSNLVCVCVCMYVYVYV